MHIRSSVGVGLIWDSPFGPLRFDMAFPLTKQSYDQHAAVPLRRRDQILIVRRPADGRGRCRHARPMTQSAPFSSIGGRGSRVREIAALRAPSRSPAPISIGRITGIAALDRAAPHDLAFLDKPKYADQLSATRRGACLTTSATPAVLPPMSACSASREPYRAFVEVARTLFPDALRPSSLFEASGVATGAYVHPSARLESGVTDRSGCRHRAACRDRDRHRDRRQRRDRRRGAHRARLRDRCQCFDHQ